MQVSTACELGAYITARRDRLPAVPLRHMMPGYVVAIQTKDNPDEFKIVVVVAPAMKIDDSMVLFAKVGDESFENIDLAHDNICSCTVIGAAIGSATERMLWSACEAGKPTEVMLEVMAMMTVTTAVG